jgi:hypothetical protein
MGFMTRKAKNEKNKMFMTKLTDKRYKTVFAKGWGRAY